MKKQAKRPSKYLYYISIASLIFIFGVFVLEKSHVTNFYTKKVDSNATESIRPVNDVLYTPADPTDNNDINEQKNNGSIEDSNPNQAMGTPINVVFTAAGQDVAGGPVVVKILLTDTNTGTCDIVLSKDSVSKKYSTSVINTGTYYTCDGFEVPLEDLEQGKWTIVATVTNADRTGTATQTLEVEN